MFNEQNDVLWLIWRNDVGESFKIGELHKRNDKYYFKYDAEGVAKANEYDFKMPKYLPKVDAEYFREELFRTFSERIPNKSKKSVEDILKQYGIEEYDEFELLRKTGGKIEGDSFEFIEPREAENVM